MASGASTGSFAGPLHLGDVVILRDFEQSLALSSGDHLLRTVSQNESKPEAQKDGVRRMNRSATDGEGRVHTGWVDQLSCQEPQKQPERQA